MTIIVDTNILFSACLTPSRRIYEILYNVPSDVQLISCQYAIEELALHKSKLVRLSQQTEEEIDILIISVLKQIDFFNENIIESTYWHEADRLTKNVDHKDINFVALALQTDGLLWTGDKKLTEHLRSMGFDHVIDTASLYELLNIG